MEEFRMYYNIHIEPKIRAFDSKIIEKNKKSLYFGIIVFNIILGICMYLFGNIVDIVYVCANILFWATFTKSLGQTLLYCLLPMFVCCFFYFSIGINRTILLAIIMPILLVYMISAVCYMPRYKKVHINSIRQDVINAIFYFINSKNSFFTLNKKIFKIKSTLRKTIYKLFNCSKFWDSLHSVVNECMQGELNGLKLDVCDVCIKNTIDSGVGRYRTKKVAILFDGQVVIITGNEICNIDTKYIIRRKLNNKLHPILPWFKTSSGLDTEKLYDSHSKNTQNLYKLLISNVRNEDEFEIIYFENGKEFCVPINANTIKELENSLSSQIIELCNELFIKNTNLDNITNQLTGISIYNNKICIFLNNTSKYHSFVNNLSTDYEFESVYNYYLDLQIATEIINILKNIYE